MIYGYRLKPTRKAKWEQERAVQHTYQQAMAALFCICEWRCIKRGNNRLSLGVHYD